MQSIVVSDELAGVQGNVDRIAALTVMRCFHRIQERFRERRAMQEQERRSISEMIRQNWLVDPSRKVYEWRPQTDGSTDTAGEMRTLQRQTSGRSSGAEAGPELGKLGSGNNLPVVRTLLQRTGTSRQLMQTAMLVQKTDRAVRMFVSDTAVELQKTKVSSIPVRCLSRFVLPA
jgi:hypothetical protein